MSKTTRATGKEPIQNELLYNYGEGLEYYMKMLESATERMPNSTKMKAEKDWQSKPESQHVAKKEA